MKKYILTFIVLGLFTGAVHANEYLLPGTGIVDETTNNAFLLPGTGIYNENSGITVTGSIAGTQTNQSGAISANDSAPGIESATVGGTQTQDTGLISASHQGLRSSIVAGDETQNTGLIYSITGKPNTNGAYTWIQEPRGVTANNITFIGYGCGGSGFNQIHVAAITNSSVTLSSNLQTTSSDDHDAPSLYIRKDGKICVFHTFHNALDYVRFRISSNAYDVSAWGSQADIGSNNYYTYTQVWNISSENSGNGKVYLFTRTYDPDTSQWWWAYATSTDDGSTWSDFANFVTDTSLHQLYIKTWGNGTDTIHICLATNPATSSSSLYYCKYTGGNLYKADGTLIGALNAGPYDLSALDMVYDYSTVGHYKTWVMDIQADSNGIPSMVFTTYPSSTSQYYNYARWTGAAWQTAQINLVTGYPVDTSTDGTVYGLGGICFDRRNLNTMYLSTFVNQFEIKKATTTNGLTFNLTSITSNSPTGASNINIKPSSILNCSQPFSVFWMYGAEPDYTQPGTVILAGYSQTGIISDGGLSLGLGVSGGNVPPWILRH